MKYIKIATILLFLLENTAYPWGYAAHMNHYDEILNIYPAGDQSYGDLIRDFREYFLYGSIFPDNQFTNELKPTFQKLYHDVESKGEVDHLTYKIIMDDVPDYEFPFGFNTHDRVHAFEFAEFMLVKANLSDPPGIDPGNGSISRAEKLAFACGYYAHLCEDIAGHDLLIPKLIGESSLGALSIIKPKDPPETTEVQGESEAAVEVMLDYRLGSTACNLVKDIVYSGFWVTVGQIEPNFTTLDADLRYGAAWSQLGIANPTIGFFHACLTEWYALHPDYFEHPPISISGLVAMCHMFRFYNRFYPQIVGYGSFPNALGEWVGNHISWNWAIDLIGWIFTFAAKDFWDEWLADMAADNASGEIKGKLVNSAKVLFGYMNYSLSSAHNLISDKQDLINTDELNRFEQSSIFTNANYLINPFQNTYKKIGGQIFLVIHPTNPWAEWSPWNEYSMRWGVQTSLNHYNSSIYEVLTDIGVYDCYFTLNGNIIRNDLIHTNEIGSNSLQAHVDLYNIADIASKNITVKVKDLENHIIVQNTSSIDQNPFNYGTESRKLISTSNFGIQQLGTLSESNNGLIIELYANSSTKPFFTTDWSKYDALDITDNENKYIYNYYHTFNYWPYGLQIDYIRDLIFNEDMIFNSGIHNYTATNSIQAGEPHEFIINNGAGVNFSAGNFIKLLSGFHCKSGGNFYANIYSQQLKSIDFMDKPSISKTFSTKTHITYIPIINRKLDDDLVNSNLDDNTRIILYPNPTNGIFTIEQNGLLYESTYIELTNIAGSLVFRKTTNQTGPINIDISDKPDGMYIVKIIHGNNSKIYNVIKE